MGYEGRRKPKADWTVLALLAGCVAFWAGVAVLVVVIRSHK